eukprot:gene27305-biopygen17813
MPRGGCSRPIQAGIEYADPARSILPPI